MKKQIFGAVCLLLTVFSACQLPQAHRLEGVALGTYYAITYFGEPQPHLAHAIDSILQEINQNYSIFDSTSVVSRLNRNQSVSLSDNFCELVRNSLIISNETSGAFDITVAPLVNLFGFGKHTGEPITANAIDSVRSFVGYEKIWLNEGGQLTKADPRVQLDFNAIAKGRAVDEIAQYFTANGYPDVLIDIGGEVRAEGHKHGKQPWRVGIQIPTETRDGLVETNYIFHLSGKSVATSGNYRNYKEVNGQRFSHIIDPHTCANRTSNLLSVSVIADNCATADAYATAFMVMGVQAALDFLAGHPELAAHFIFFENGNYQYLQTENFPRSL